MFTGLIEEVGRINSSKPFGGGLAIEIFSKKLTKNAKVGDSIAVNGVCLTITKLADCLFSFDAVSETINKTTLRELKTGAKVNLEPALKIGQNLGGHLVQGHVNNTGKLTSITNKGENYLVTLSFPVELQKYIVNEGSIAIDGISLTVAQINSNELTCSIIPHTWKNSNLCYKFIGEKVNIEVDILAKYAENFRNNLHVGKQDLTEEWLKKIGY
ncbi:MAG: riboflavin synthase alpha subunit [Ignavibacteria bacterium]|nr:MAG: riboflavin synthase alpha subunit [Ignavibacteria bacterium]KAF0155542.1 MAG: riboflavin synthase alpha subunit [Ignavibacteria bacterium]